MNSKILINALDPEECRISKIKANKLEEFHIETSSKEITKSNIYKGIITRVEPALQAVFVDYGGQRHGFLQKQEIHSDYFADNNSGGNSLENFVKVGQEVLVQIGKDPFMKKGAMLTTFISLPGRYLVLMPGRKNIGISRKIEDETERNRLKELVSNLQVPDEFGVIVRTVGDDCNKTLMNKDLKYLLRLWKNISDKGIDEKAPAILYKERSLAVRTIRDHLTPDVSEIIIDDKTVYNEVKNFIKIIAPKQTSIVKQYKGQEPIFAKYQLDEQISTIFKSLVKLKAGGSIVIEQTEAMVTVDVNSGKSIKEKSIEQTATQTNIEAAEEIMRQLRLRDLGGLIVIDFIDMRESKNKLKVEKAVKKFAKEDKARMKVGKITKFGLLEMSRQRIRSSIEYGSYVTCKYCKGKGLVLGVESLGLSFLRKLCVEALKKGIAHAKCYVPIHVAQYILNKKREELLKLETKHGISISIFGDSNLMPGDCKIDLEKIAEGQTIRS